ncbi:ArsR family transcriptional regulator [Halodesulfurarchaeum formicicum]|uniref:ArsR family transcriptional regulator n=1 Tax=Halodesulfurarchaeum formicicum TaxID=1873524 RepID=A0A1D8S5Z8_9EURY|nr:MULTISPECIES: ArsR family transcriptional regulator [Halodesulfurarchaeum]AOW80777.1 ArsR family transcriptional regulator [Halodesulfurarchaeum formicicum]APE96112.1 ArsR family transcriptional regulator [Halodesulfurarchaeum formicicum]MDR5656624.1 ArsR family transcriptional regulator [Halodesulfurarchaeum sp. HSR-GB]
MTDQPCLDELPPSAKLVYKVLEYDGPLTQKRIVEESMLSARTVRYALDRLDDCQQIEEQVYFQDARQSLYQLRSPAERTEESSAEAELA